MSKALSAAAAIVVDSVARRITTGQKTAKMV
jgi:hypothetical protein